MAERRLATIETIASISPIPQAEAIVRARVRGWDVVVKKDEFLPGDTCVYFEVDSMLDVSDPRFEFLAPRGVRVDENGREFHVLKTARLRGQYSQGLVVSTELFPELGEMSLSRVGEDVTEVLKIEKWDPPLPPEILDIARGYLPSWLKASNEVRVQNDDSLLGTSADWEATEKIDGISTSFYVDGETQGACSRNVDLLDSANPYWDKARELDVFTKLRTLGSRVALQGETFGEGINRNPLRIKGKSFRAFALYVDREEIPRGQWPQWVKDISVPVHDLPFPSSVEEALLQVESLKSKINSDRPIEGIVWRSAQSSMVTTSEFVSRASFKVISNRYLLKNQ